MRNRLEAVLVVALGRGGTGRLADHGLVLLAGVPEQGEVEQGLCKAEEKPPNDDERKEQSNVLLERARQGRRASENVAKTRDNMLQVMCALSVLGKAGERQRIMKR